MRDQDAASNFSWQKRFRSGYFVAAQIATYAPRRGAILSTLSGESQLYTWDPLTGNLNQLTHTPGGFLAPYRITPDGKYLVYLQDEGGSNIGHYVRHDYDDGEISDLTPDLPPYPGISFDMSRDGNILGFTIATEQGFEVHLVDLSAPARPMWRLTSFTSFALGPSLSSNGSVAIVASTARSESMAFGLEAFSREGDKLAELWDGPDTSFEIACMSRRPEDPRALVIANERGTTSLLIWNPISNSREYLSIAALGASVQSADWSEDASKILVNSANRGKQELFVFDLATRSIQQVTPVGMHWQPFFGPDGNVVSTYSNATEPWRPVLISADDGSLVRVLVGNRIEVPGRHEQSIEITSADGVLIQGWMLVPEGLGPHPTIINLHGGPAEVDLGGFSAGLQAFVDHGFLVLSLNYRGSTTFGRDFQTTIYGRLGELELLDIGSARQHLVDLGLADPRLVFLVGSSYGGYLSILGMGKDPDLYAGAIAEAVITDWQQLYETGDPAGRGQLVQFMGCVPSEDPDRYRGASPISYISSIQNPILIFQGINDTRTPVSQATDFADMAARLGKPVETVLYDSGHGSSDVEIWIEQTAKKLRFLGSIVNSRRGSF